MIEAYIKVTGKVQTVGFREFTKNRADDAGLYGYVENQEDGSVEVVVQGEKEAIERLVEELWKGPVFSRVDNVEVSWSERSQDAFLEFEIW